MKLNKASKRDRARHKRIHGMRVRRGRLVHIGNSRQKREDARQKRKEAADG